MLNQTGMNFETISVPGPRVLEELDLLRGKFNATGKYPFLIGDSEELQYLAEAAGFLDDSFSVILEKSHEIDVAEWFQKTDGEYRKYEYDEVGVLGEWPEKSLPSNSMTVHRDILTGKLRPAVLIGLAPIQIAWQLPAATKYGGWNDCPFPEVHCAIMRYWQEKYGAEIVSMSHDVIECLIQRPPATKAVACELAMEQFWYCSDIVYQGCGSVNNLAATLLDATIWYFWWD